ncbi:MAG: hypothetical protein A2096_14080 [Spirochaetes bacterium GWF1_41_5]|nr:MAG: hypothetical protein A2096_14080 [Spirochaetes bacterium GWF1_41_5]
MIEHDKPVTIVDIAKDTGLSIATVSRALNNSQKVTDKTRRKIKESASRLKYIPNEGAKALVQGTTNTIGLLLNDLSPASNTVYTILNEMTAKRDYKLLVFNSLNQINSQEHCIIDMLNRRITGIIIIPLPGAYHSLEPIYNSGTPCVIINRFVREFNFSHVIFDFRIGVCEAVDYLVISRQRKHFFQLANMDVYAGLERRKAFQFALKANQIDHSYNPVYPVDDSFKSGYEAMSLILNEHPEADAVICSSDYTAAGAIRACRDNKKKVPEDISITGYYNSEISEYFIPRISSIDANFSELCRTALDKMIAMIKNHEDHPENFSLPTRFIRRETS